MTPTDITPKSAKTPTTIRVSRGEGYGGRPYEVGQTIRNEGGRPAWLVVLRAGSKYYREDGLSVGVGDDSGSVFWAECRGATEAEIAPLLAAIEGNRRLVRARKALGHMHAHILREGEYLDRLPSGEQHLVEGEEIMLPASGDRLYGGGRWLVIQAEWVWAVANNGADGDDWARNNVRTGGAGAIGRRVPATPALAAEIRRLAGEAGHA